MRQQDLRLGSKQQPAIEDAPVEWFLAETITGNEQTPAFVVPKRKRKHAVEMLDHSRSMLFIKVRQNFRVRSAAKGVATLFQISAQFAIVIDFAVQNYGD